MEEVWRRLPTELIKKIVEMADLPIDTRLFFKILPKKINEKVAWKLWYLLCNDGIFYNLDSKSLHNFRVPGVHIVRRPVSIVFTEQNVIIFNRELEEHSLEITTSNGHYLHQSGQKEPISTSCKVILKGGGVCPAVFTSDSREGSESLG